MEIKKVYLIHSKINTPEALCNFLGIDINKLPFKMVVDRDEPDYLFCTFGIFSDSNDFKELKALYHKAKVVICLEGEAITPDFNIFDYAMGFDKTLEFGDRYCRIPTRSFFSSLISARRNELENDFDGAKKELTKKTDFCNFIYSNSHGHRKRKEIFDTISTYKEVDSLGRYLNNKRVPQKSVYGKSNWESIVRESIAIRKPYKFSISCENARFDGYTSEKIFSALTAHTVPIYWGNKYIVEEINPKAFVDCNKIHSDQELIEVVRRIDEDDELWCRMVSEPWMTERQLKRENEDQEKLLKFFVSIFEQPLDRAKRRAEGSAEDIYVRWFFKQGRRSFSQIVNKILDKL